MFSPFHLYMRLYVTAFYLATKSWIPFSAVSNLVLDSPIESLIKIIIFPSLDVIFGSHIGLVIFDIVFFFHILRSCFLSLKTKLNTSVLHSLSDTSSIYRLWGLMPQFVSSHFLFLAACFFMCVLWFVVVVVKSITWNSMHENPLKVGLVVCYCRKALHLPLPCIWRHCQPGTSLPLSVCIWKSIEVLIPNSARIGLEFSEVSLSFLPPLSSLSLIILSFFCSWGEFFSKIVSTEGISPSRGIGFNHHTLCGY